MLVSDPWVTLISVIVALLGFPDWEKSKPPPVVVADPPRVEDPCEAKVVSSHRTSAAGYLSFTIGLHSCERRSNLIMCGAVITNHGDKGIYKSDLGWWRSKLTDENNADYNQTSAYLLFGYWEKKETVALEDGQCAWLTQEFEDKEGIATQANISYDLTTHGGERFVLRAQIKSNR